MNTFSTNDIGRHIQVDELDYNPKAIGDRVQVLNYSSVSYKNGLPVDLLEENIDGQTVFIVIETHKRVEFETPYNTYIQDILMVDAKTKKQYRAMSNHIKLWLTR